ncbi:MAG: phosphoglycerate kinase [Patescibacteria group bacterium]
MKPLSSISSFAGQRVLVRVDFNVPVAEGKVVDDFRIRETLPTIEFLRKAGAKVILISHFEGEGGTLVPVAKYLEPLFGVVTFVKNYSDPSFLESVPPGSVVLCENLRLNPGEKKNAPKFAQTLAAFGDIYVNEAFSVSHREHASIVSVPKLLPSYAGFRFESEVKNLQALFTPAHPFLVVLCGAKFDTKLPLIEKFLSIADFVFVGGALANNLFKKKELSIGKSLYTEGHFNEEKLLSNPKLLIPQDVVVLNDGSTSIVSPEKITADDVIVDCGPKTIETLKVHLAKSKTILWNGPFGIYEKGFTESTKLFAQAIAESGVHSVVGGGDTIASIASLSLQEKFSFISTGGGAMLDFLAKETLPGIEALSR